MFAGMDDLPWSQMKHAYGDASEVPELLRGLMDDDPAVRETALDAMYGTVHHQGDVYDSTLAAVPFLVEIAAMVGLPGRGKVVELLASIGSSEDADLTAQRPLFEALLDDLDVEVRRTAPAALLTVRGDDRSMAAMLRSRFAEETDAETREAIVRAVGAVARRGGDPDSGPWLAALDTDDAGLRLAAVAELAASSPELLPPDVVPSVLGLLRIVYAGDEDPAEPAGFTTDTLIGAVREMFERESTGRRAPSAADLVRTVSLALGDRVGDRTSLLVDLLRARQWEARYDALRPAKVLIDGWRGDFRELVALMGNGLFDSSPRVQAVAASTLEHLDVLAAPAADALVRSLESADREAAHDHGGTSPWVIAWRSDLPTVGPTLSALAGARDKRALPMLEWALDRPDMAGDLGYRIGNFGPDAAFLVPAIRRRLADLPVPERFFDRRRGGLIFALSRMGPAAAPALPELLDVATRDDFFIRALGRIGGPEAAALLRELLSHGDPRFELAAATALWQIEPDEAAVVPVVTRHLASANEWHVKAALAAVAQVPPAARESLTRLRRTLRGTKDPHGWNRLSAATGVWRATGDAEAVLPTLVTVWGANLYTRRDILGLITEMRGVAADTGFTALVEREVATASRHTARGDGHSTSQIPEDLELLTLAEAYLKN